MKKLHLRHFACLLMLLFTAHWSWGQGTTTSSMSGIITDQKGEGLPGATVIAIHTPTNTQYVGPTNSQGRFNLQNMRVGGPYTVRVSFVGFQEVSRNNIQLTVGQDYRLDVKMLEATTELGAVTITAVDPRSTLNAERSGTVTNINTEAIQRLPTINRSLNDFLRLTPQAAPSNGALAIGGGNYRQNNITVDGSDFNNNFGIGGNLPAGGSPISIDAISELTVNLTPFDVRQSGFVGAAVNAVTRSGSNEFQGSIYSFYRNQNYIGNKVGSETFTKQTTNIKQYGFRLGGPIIKDKLWFFINAEKGDEINPGQQNFASTPTSPYGSASNIARPLASTLDGYSRLLQERYGYATGPYQGYDFVSNNTRLLGRLDWQINDNNHFQIRYSQVESKTPSFVSGSRTPLTNYPTGAGRTNINALAFANSNYFSEANFYSLAAELNSTIGHGHKFYNTLRGTYTRQNDPRSSNSSIFPFVDILDGPVTRAANGSYASYNTPYTSFGYEPFTAGNLRDVETYSGVDFASTTFGNHTLTLGGQFDLQTTKNGFQRFATSYYTYNSWDDFIGGSNPVDFALTYSLLPNFEQAFPRFKTAQTSAYLQDEYVVSDRLRLTVGLRAELNSYLNVQEIQTNRPVAALSFMEGKRIDTGILPTNRVLFSPRVGFNWDVKGDRTLQLRGGSGVFTGKVPTVWIVAQSGDAGLIQVTQTYRGLNNPTAFVGIPGTTGGNLPFNPDPNAYRPTTVPAAGSVIPSTLSATDPNFKNPQSWKSSLAVDTKLPGGIIGTLEGIYNQDLVVALGQNYNLVAPTKLNIAGYADNRDIYPSTPATKYINPINNAGQAVAGAANAFDPVVLTNGNRPFGKNGYYWSATAKLEKQFRGGIQASLAYVRSDARVLYDGTGDQLANTWSLTPTVNNANNTDLSYANYVVPDRIVASLSYRKEYINHLATQVSFFYAGSSQGRYSYIYGADFNRDGQTNDLIYIPRNASEITFSPFNYGTTAAPNNLTAAQQSTLFENYISQDPYLSKHRGEYAERNGATLPWRHQIDFRFAQDLFVMAGKRNTLQFTLDVFNLGNLLNKNWGVYQTINNSSILVPTNQNALVAGGTVTPTFRLATDRGTPITSTYRNNVSLTSTYYMQVGVRYLFN